MPRAELERAKRYLVGAHEISLQRRAALASTLAFHEAYGVGWDEYRRYAPGILAVTAADVQRVARKYLVRERAIIATVKPEERDAGRWPVKGGARRRQGGPRRRQSHSPRNSVILTDPCPSTRRSPRIHSSAD